MKKATLKEWQEIGKQTKIVKKELDKLINLSADKMPQKIIDSLSRSFNYLLSFQSEAEDKMMETGISDDTHIFYGVK